MDRNYSIKISTAEPKPSLSVRRAWIEMLESKQIDPSVMSLSVRRAWIEIGAKADSVSQYNASLSVRRAWIEIFPPTG